MPFLGFGGDYSPYYYSVSSSRVGPGSEGSSRPVANGTSTIGSQVDPLLGVPRETRLNSHVRSDRAGIEQMIAFYNGHGQRCKSFVPNESLPQALEPAPPTSAAAVQKRPTLLDSAERTIACSPKRRRSPSRKLHNVDEGIETRSSSTSSRRSNDIKDKTPSVVLTLDHYKLLVEHHANLINELQETELMVSVYEQQRNLHARANDTETIRSHNRNSGEKRPNQFSQSGGGAKKVSSKKKQG